MGTSDTSLRFSRLLATQSPANFAMVMSTGIVSMALHLLEFPRAATLLFQVNICMFAILWALYILRLVRWPRRFATDFISHANGPGFLTMVAGTCILGNQFALLIGQYTIAGFLFWLGVALWGIILWGVFFAMFTVSPKPPLERGINGAWLVATVSTQSIVILGSGIVENMPWNKELAFFIFITMFLLGLMLYIFVITMIFYRFCFRELAPAEMNPTFWINAGAVAITTLAGAQLMLKGGESAMVASFLPFIRGGTLLAWATATWWIPMLFLLGIWRHAIRRYPFVYTTAFWGMVFPMGMYTTCTVMLSKALNLPILMVIPQWFVYVALSAWCITFAGMLVSRGTALLRAPNPKITD